VGALSQEESQAPRAPAWLWVRSPCLFFSPRPKPGPQPGPGGQEACSLAPLSEERRSTPPMCHHPPPHPAQQHQLAKHVAKYQVKQQRRRRPGNSPALRESLADTREETSLEKPRKKDCSYDPGFSGAVTTHFWKPLLPHVVFLLAGL